MNDQDRSESYKKWVVGVRAERPPAHKAEYLEGWRSFFNHYAPQCDDWRRRNAGYHEQLRALTTFLVPPNMRVLEVGCATGDLLASTRPSHGVGVDISDKMVEIAARKHPELTFHCMSAEDLDLGGETFDYVILSDLLGFLYDIRLVLERVRLVCHSRTRILINWYSRLWQPVVELAERLGLKYPQPLLNWTTVEDVANFLYLSGYDVVCRRSHILLPKRIPALAALLNRYTAQMPGLRHLCLTNWMVARPLGVEDAARLPSISIVCPCRNEAGNIEQIAARIPQLGPEMELIFVEGHSRDDTLAECRRVQNQFPEKRISVYVQEGNGKGDAVRLGFAKARGDVLMILDADLSVAPEDLEQFYDALVREKGDFINGSRLVYAMDPKAMRFLNLLGNKFFALILSRLIGQPIKDTLCGTKVLRRIHYEQLAQGRSYFGNFDPFGDFDLLFGAAKLNLKIVEVPVRYRQRTYGSTNISRFSDGLLLLRMCRVAASKLYFIR